MSVYTIMPDTDVIPMLFWIYEDEVCTDEFFYEKRDALEYIKKLEEQDG